MSEPLLYTTEIYAYVFAALKLWFGPNSSHNNTTIAFNTWYHAIMHLVIDFFSLLQKARMLTAKLKTIINSFRGKKKRRWVSQTAKQVCSMGLTLCILCLLNFRSVTANWVGQSCLVLSAEETGTLLDWVLWEGDSLLLQICSVHGDPFRQSESSFKSWYKSSSPPTQTKSCAKWGVGIVFRFAQLFIKKNKNLWKLLFRPPLQESQWEIFIPWHIGLQKG